MISEPTGTGPAGPELTKTTAFWDKTSGMTRLGKLQLVGPIVLFVAVLASEIAARALAYAPASETVWYIHLNFFGIFQKARFYMYNYIPDSLPDFIPLVNTQLFFAVLPIFLAALLGFALRNRLILAIAGNLSFICAAFLLFIWYTDEKYAPEASLVIIGVPLGPNLYMSMALLAASLPSFLISHFLYLQDCRK